MNMFCSTATAKSLYLVGGTEDTKAKVLWVFDVMGDGSLALQATKIFPGRDEVQYLNGLGMDPKTKILFVTYNRGSHAGIFDSQTLDWLGFVYLVPVDMYAGGMVYDPKAERLYTTDIGTDRLINRLIIYNWDPDRKLLLNIGYGPSEVPLEAENLGAIALNEAKDLVYVASTTPDVQVLKTAFAREDWTQAGRISTDYVANSLGVDSTKQLLYAGGEIGGNATVTQYNLTTNTKKSVVVGQNIGTVLSISADNSTSLVYVLIGNTPSLENDARVIMVLDSTLKTFYTMPFKGLARALYIPSTPIGYNSLNLAITPVSGVVTVNDQFVTGPGSMIEYQVCMTNENLLPVTDLTVTDLLPDHLDFVNDAHPDNATSVYDATTRTYQYNLDRLDPAATHCFRLFARVKDSVMPGTVVTNSVVLDSHETPSTTASVDVKVEYNAMGLTKTVVMNPDHIRVGNTTYVDTGGLVTYEVCLSNTANEYPVMDVLLVDELPAEVEFVAADEGGVSAYDPNTHTFSWAFDTIEPNDIRCFQVVVRVKDTVVPGQLITNKASVAGREVVPVSTETSVVTKFNALALNMGIKPSNDYDPVTSEIHRGALITYVIDVGNVDAKYTAAEVIMIDSVPSGLEYVSANFDGATGQYDPVSHTVTATRPTLGPNKTFRVELTFKVKDDLMPETVLTNQVIAMANGTPVSSVSKSVKVFQALKPLTLTKSVVPDPTHVMVGDTTYVDAGGIVTYELCLGNPDNTSPVRDVLLVDKLPQEVEFIRADAGGVSFYDTGTHTYSWFFDAIDPNYAACFKVVVRVKADVTPGQIITNTASLDGLGMATVSTPVSVTAKLEPLTLTKSVVADPNYMLIGDTYHVDAGSLVTYELCVGNPANQFPVTGVLLVDKLPQEVEFISADSGGVGVYDVSAHTYTWSFASIAPNYMGCFKIVVRVRDEVASGQIITNEAILSGHGTATVSVPVSVVTKSMPMVLATPKIYYTAPLLRNDHKDELMLDMTFPSSVKLADIDVTQPLSLTPGTAKSYHSQSSSLRTTYKVYGADGEVRILALFDRQPVLDQLLPGQTKVTLSVTGLFINGQSFIAQITVPVK
ncbi:MAG: DUF11 domain-containing protein [Phycisphaerae bacterium]|nr:DUF11 domain-containing protein [Phycisphaerae bacterium]